MSAVIPVILCGGSGTRLWPLSRSDRPKQFIALACNHTLLEGTLLRAAKIKGAEGPICVTAEAHATAVRSSLKRLGIGGQLLLEPCARNTAPALCAAAITAMRTEPDAILVALPADHIIEDDTAFATSIAWACAAARNSHIVVLGVTPRHAATGFGYIIPGENLEGFQYVRRIEKFIEKPGEEAARNLIERGALWNAGIVVARATAVVRSLERYAPPVLEAVEKSLGAERIGEDAIRLDAEAFAAAPSISFDKAVLERSSDVVVAQLPAMWRDVGTWDAVAELFGGDIEGNRHHGPVHLSASMDNFVFSPNRLTVGLGLKDLVVVDTPDALLIANRHHLRDLGEVVAAMAGDHIPEAGVNAVRSNSNAVNATAGDIRMRQIVLGAGQGETSSSQNDVTRYWIVLEGTVEVTIDKATSRFTAHQSFHVEPGQACRFFNREASSAKLIDVRLEGKIKL